MTVRLELIGAPFWDNEQYVCKLLSVAMICAGAADVSPESTVICIGRIGSVMARPNFEIRCPDSALNPIEGLQGSIAFLWSGSDFEPFKLPIHGYADYQKNAFRIGHFIYTHVVAVDYSDVANHVAAKGWNLDALKAFRDERRALAIPDSLKAAMPSNEQRARRKEERAVRDVNFRNRVFSGGERVCSVCECEVEEGLEAAHIVPVSKGGRDEPYNGLVLCCLHHRYWDRGVFDLRYDDAERRVVVSTPVTGVVESPSQNNGPNPTEGKQFEVWLKRLGITKRILNIECSKCTAAMFTLRRDGKDLLPSNLGYLEVCSDVGTV